MGIAVHVMGEWLHGLQQCMVYSWALECTFCSYMYKLNHQPVRERVTASEKYYKQHTQQQTDSQCSHRQESVNPWISTKHSYPDDATLYMRTQLAVRFDFTLRTTLHTHCMLTPNFSGRKVCRQNFCYFN